MSLLFKCTSFLLAVLLAALVCYVCVMRYRARSKEPGPVAVAKDPGSNDELFCNLEKWFQDEKPYLNPELGVSDLSAKLLTNRTYLSAAIKANGMINFNYYVNSYRVREAMEIFIKEPGLRIGEVAFKCGFNSASTFTMAFKAYVNMTPTQWRIWYLQKPVSEDGSQTEDIGREHIDTACDNA